ncbi:MAG: DUF692 family protein [Myxococcota bacterium]|nr:DUF692 family protein [Myxococcota bacterium]
MVELGVPVARTQVGLAHGGATRRFLERHPEGIDYLEIPFELLQHDPRVLGGPDGPPVVLHCASLSVAGTAPCPDETLDAIRSWVERVRTPWLGEHLAYVTAPALEGGEPERLHHIGYTTSAPMNERTLERVLRNLGRYEDEIPVPLLLENSPLYFEIPTSTMSQGEFLRRLCAARPVGLLLDLAHHYITCRNLGLDPFRELEGLPLESVIEVHISGVSEQRSGVWDDHARPAPDAVHAMFRELMRRVRPRAVTLEYNWSSEFPVELLAREIERVRDAIDLRGAPS